jgi:MFS family permease
MSVQPDPGLSPDVQALASRHPEYVAALSARRRWNFGASIADSGTFAITKAALAETTVLPYFVSQLTANALVIGLSPAIAWLGLYLPQLLGAFLVHSQTRRKPFIVLMAWLERVGIGVMLLISLGVGRLPTSLVLAAFLLVYLAYWLNVGLLIPPYSDFYAKHIPSGRGMFLGVQTLMYGGMGLVGAALVREFLNGAGFPLNMQRVLLLALVASLPSMIAFHLLREVAFPVQPARQKLGAYLAAIPGLLRRNPPFVSFLVVRSVLALGKMTTPFLTVYAVQRFGLASGTVGTYTAVMFAAQTVSALGWGWLGDRLAYHWIWLLDALIVFALSALAWWAPAPGWFLLVFLLVGLSLGAESTAQPNTIYTLSPPAETVRFIGLANSLLGPALSLGPLLAGSLINRFSYPATLAVGAFAAALGLAAVAAWMIYDRRLAHQPYGSLR